MKVKSFLYGLMTGGLAAGVSVLLTAPNSGKVTREKMKENTQSVLNQLQVIQKNLLELKNSAIHASKEGRAQISTFLTEVKSALAQWEEEVSPQQERIQKEINEMKNTIQELEDEISDNNK
ncbi:YtxH domain-containing protein [Neobacillus drentensis]|uniref:YtxH domain-containing protein n=1 Tax=Neobacillus drentensis TaxID=220684 RepID=UPI001F27D112|nr:YtxH domain-containing protein [Neobacillus drentensis]ULT58074.1 YtxH domain-containing protein [Neobacillus drentensis]